MNGCKNNENWKGEKVNYVFYLSSVNPFHTRAHSVDGCSDLPRGDSTSGSPLADLSAFFLSHFL